MAAPNPLNPDTRLSFRISGTSHENPALILHYKIQASDNLDQAKFVSNRNTVNAAGTTLMTPGKIPACAVLTPLSSTTPYEVVIRGHVKLITPPTTTATGVALPGLIRVVMWVDRNSPNKLPKISSPIHRTDPTVGGLTITLTNDPNYNPPDDTFDGDTTNPPPTEATPVDTPLTTTSSSNTTVMPSISVTLVP